MKWTVFSIGGGSIQIKEHPVNYNDEVYQSMIDDVEISVNARQKNE